MTRLLIVADMEGITGIERYEQCIRKNPEYDAGVQLLCAEVNVIADSALKSGAQSVSVIDWHGGGGNIDRSLLDERVDIVPEDLSTAYDLAMLIGFHPMAGDIGGFISHTMRQGLAVEVGGQQIGELSLLACWLGEHGVPIGLISGDRAATAEADRFFPETPVHTVKRAESWAQAICIPPEQSYEVLRARVARVMEQRGRWQTYAPTTPIPFRLKLRESNPLPGLLPWIEQDADGWLSGRVEYTRELIDLIDVVSALIDMQLHSSVIATLSKDAGVLPKIEKIREWQIVEATESGYWQP